VPVSACREASGARCAHRRTASLSPPGHISLDIEAVIEEHTQFWIIDKQGAAGELTEKLA
jgi:hypothetical protein